MKQKIKYIIFAVLLGLVIGFLYNHIAIPDSYKREFFCYKHSVKVRNLNYVEMAFPILHKETYSLKISSPEDKKKKIVVNDSILIPWKTKFYRKKHSKPVDYVLIPPEKLNIGKNDLKIYLSSNISTWVTMRLRNYKGNSSNRIFVLFKDSHILPLKRSPVVYLYSTLIVLFMFLLLSWRTGEDIYSKILISLLPANILLLLAYIIPATLNLRLVVMSCYFWALQAVLFCLIYFAFFYNYNKKIISENIKETYLSVKELRLSIRQLNAKLEKKFSRIYSLLVIMIVIIMRCLKYLHSRVRLFSDKCIVLFVFLLLMCAFFLMIHSEKLAEKLANVAYVALCLGVVIKFVQFVRDKDR